MPRVGNTLFLDPGHQFAFLPEGGAAIAQVAVQTPRGINRSDWRELVDHILVANLTATSNWRCLDGLMGLARWPYGYGNYHAVTLLRELAGFCAAFCHAESHWRCVQSPRPRNSQKPQLTESASTAPSCTCTVGCHPVKSVWMVQSRLLQCKELEKKSEHSSKQT